jgi:thioredoxin-dependent peroxiredoxin
MAGKRSKGSAKSRPKSRKPKSKSKITRRAPRPKAKAKPAKKASRPRPSAASRAARPKAKSTPKPKARPVAATPSRRQATPMAAGSKGAAPKSAPARGAAGKPARAGKAAKRPESSGIVQGAFDFEIEPPESSLAIEAHLPPAIHPPRRRGSPKANSPDYPGDSLTVGMPAPEFSLPSTLGRPVGLSEFRGKRVVLYFYPKDDTPGCTMEACAFRDALPRVESKDAVVLGISLDDELSHQRFVQKYNLNFPLLSDKDALVSRQYGTYKEKNLYGRSFWGIERTTFVIDREGKVEHVFRRVKVEGHAEEVMATLAG